MRAVVRVCVAAALMAALPSSAAATHAGDVNCSDFATQAAAQSHLLAHPGDPDGLDGDSNGRACQALPCPCSATNAPAPPPPPAMPPPPATTPSSTVTARVIRVIDGDTLKVRLRSGADVSVRLIGIDTPETRKPGTRVQCGGRQATARMKQLALRNGRGRDVSLRSDLTQDQTDRFGRKLSYVSSAGRDFGRTMILSGWAKTYVYNVDFQRVARYRNAEAAAKAAKRGVWRRCDGNFHTPA